MMILGSVLLVNNGICLAASKNNVQLSQETKWISLDLPIEQRVRIDEVIASKYEQVKALQKNQEILDIGNSNDFYKLVTYMSRMNEIQAQMYDEIIRLVPPERQSEFDAQQQEKEDAAQKATSTLLALKLTKAQQTKIINLLLKAKKNSWAALADTSVTWEQRIKKMQRTDVVRQISSVLDKNQRATWASWNGMILDK